MENGGARSTIHLPWPFFAQLGLEAQATTRDSVARTVIEIIPEAVNKFLDCGDLERGFARVRCDHCKHEYLLADGLFVRSGLFYVLPDASVKPLEELFRARVITFLVDKGLLPPARAEMLRGCLPGTELCSSARGAFRIQRASQPPGVARRARGP